MESGGQTAVRAKRWKPPRAEQRQSGGKTADGTCCATVTKWLQSQRRMPSGGETADDDEYDDAVLLVIHDAFFNKYEAANFSLSLLQLTLQELLTAVQAGSFAGERTGGRLRKHLSLLGGMGCAAAAIHNGL